MEYKYNFKIDANGSGRKDNTVKVKVRLEDTPIITKQAGYERETIEEFNVSASVYNRTSFIIMGGQCLDELMEYPELADNELFCQIHEMWTKYHLNTLNAGTIKQEAALKQAVAEGKLENYNADNYKNVCEYLDSVGLLEDKDFLVEDKNGNAIPYKYGHGWLAREIPPEDLEKCRRLASGNKTITKKKTDMER